MVFGFSKPVHFTFSTLPEHGHSRTKQPRERAEKPKLLAQGQRHMVSHLSAIPVDDTGQLLDIFSEGPGVVRA